MDTGNVKRECLDPPCGVPERIFQHSPRTCRWNLAGNQVMALWVGRLNTPCSEVSWSKLDQKLQKPLQDLLRERVCMCGLWLLLFLVCLYEYPFVTRFVKGMSDSSHERGLVEHIRMKHSVLRFVFAGRGLYRFVGGHVSQQL